MSPSYLSLINRVEDKYEALYWLEKGGVAYINIDIHEVFNISDVVITSFQECFNKFAWDGVTKYSSENVAHLVQQLNAVTEWLAEVSELPRYMLLLVLTVFTKCSVLDFVGLFRLMLNTERIIQL